ncbi:MAG: SpoIIE family protein phosphatase [bacterium]|nr:SpoIIE family protein phosphatase [bacterium]
MKKRYDDSVDDQNNTNENISKWEKLRGQIVGLGSNSSRKNYYPELQEQLERLERFKYLLNQSNDAILLVEADSDRVADVNRFACEIFGQKNDAIIGTLLREIANKDILSAVKKLYKNKIITKINIGKWESFTTVISNNNKNIPVEFYINLFQFNKTDYILLVGRDITERKQAEEQLRRLNLNLENLVRERTGELQISNTELTKANKNLWNAMNELETVNSQLVSTRDELWGEMKLAQKIQTVLLPHTPTIDGYMLSACMLPAKKVGGDYYDIINIENKNWIAIGDVAGHGVSAGLIMMIARTALHTTLSRDPAIAPWELVSVLNKILTQNIQQLDEHKFMSLMVLSLRENGSFNFAGLHQDILVYRNAAGTVESIESDGTLLGIIEQNREQIPEKSFTLDIGDTVLLYTDGIIEAWEKESIQDSRSPETAMFGIDRLANILKESGHKTTEEIKNHILGSMEDYDCNDDITFVLLKRLE